MSEEESKQTEKPVKKVSYVSVRVVKYSNSNNTLLVEWVENDGVSRGFIPSSEVKDDKVNKEVLLAATPYGVPWEKIEMSDVTPELIARNLRNAGIWTADDLRKNQRAALGAIQAAYNITLASCNQAAKQFQMEGDL